MIDIIYSPVILSLNKKGFRMFLLKQLQWALTSQKEKQRLMDAITGVLETVPETRALLKMAQEDHIKIYFEPRLAGTNIEGFLDEHSIAVNPFGSLSGRSVTLAHELRHYWQYKKLGITKQDLANSPRLSFIFNRIIEADAFAFEAMWAGQRAALTGGKKPHVIMTKMGKDSTISRTEIPLSYKEIFSLYMRARNIADGYDPREAAGLFHFGIQAKAPQPATGVTIHDIRKVLKEGVIDGAPGYLDNLSDRQFEALVLRHANPQAYQAVKLMEKFNAAVAANDNQSAKTLRLQIQKKINYRL